MANSNIKQINIGTTPYDIEALHFITGSLDTPAQWKAYIDSLVGEGLKIVIDTKHATKEEPATTASAATMGKLYLVQLTGQLSGSYTEFVTIELGSTTKTYQWEKIGTTDVDLSQYVKVGTRTSAAPSVNATSSAGGQTVDSADGGAQTATGTATISYDKAASATGAAGADTITSGAAGGHTVSGSNFSFSGTEETISATVTGVSINDHSYTPAGSISNSYTAAGTTAVVKSVSAVLAATPEFKGTEATISSSGSYTPAGTVSKPNIDLTSTPKSFNTDAIKEFDLAASTVTTAGPAYVESVTHTPASLTGDTTFVKSITNWNGGSASGTFNTNAIKDITLSASATSTDGPQYVESITYTKQALSGTTTFNTDAIKNVKLASSATTSTGAVSYLDNVTHTPASLTGTTTFNTDAMKASYADGVLTLSAASSATVGISGGSVSTSVKYLTGSGDAASTASVGITDGSVVATSKYMKHTTTAAGTGSVSYSAPTFTVTGGSIGISGGSIDADVKYMSHTVTAASTASVNHVTGAALHEAPAFTGTAATINVSATYTPAGTITKPSITVTPTTVSVNTDAIKAVASTFTGTAATLSHNFTEGAQGTVSFDYTPKGTIGGSQVVADHSHSVTVSSHTHSISSTTTSVTGTASVAVSAHKHSVTVAAHTHDLGNHTHNVTLNHTAA